ncbi:TBC1 domain family member 2B-like [Brevipalpus obovatus]|uniref:TBC1 domain family member 2B-like n=1 Tax=Brevipalpus obovatus TaxID=246614 RepID=UPI003D9F0535
MSYGPAATSNSIFYDYDDPLGSFDGTSRIEVPPSNSSSTLSNSPSSNHHHHNVYSSSDQNSSQNRSHVNRLSVLGRIRKASHRLEGIGGRKESSNKTNSHGCNQCSEYESQIIDLNDDLKASKNEIEASREVIKVLQLQLEAAMKERESHTKVLQSHSISEAILDTLNKKEKEVALYESKLKDAEVKIERLTNESQKVAQERDDLKEQLNLMMELIQVKDQTLMSLTNEIDDLEKMKQDSMKSVLPNHHNESEKSVDKAKESNVMDELESLKDSVIAYQMQNKCLNREIIELNETKGQLERKQQELQLKCYDWEAKCCQVHSKLLSLLKELNQTIEMSEMSGISQTILISSNNSVKELVSRLFEESSLDIPLSWRPGNRKRSDPKEPSSSDGDYDELGFLIKQPDIEPELGENFPSLKSDPIRKQPSLSDPDTTRYHFEWKVRWETFIANLKSNEIQPSLDLKCLLRTGIPQEYRCKIWRMLINFKVKPIKEKLGSDYYQKLTLNSAERQVNPAVKQIELDLLRTLPNNKHFHSIKSPGIMRLRQVLTAYSLHNPSVGYCQGMNRLAAVALLFMSEEDAFWCLLAIIERIMPPNYFVSNLLGAHVDQYVLRDLLMEKMPQLHAHFEKHGIELTLFSWFLTCFVDNISRDIYLRIWDVFLYEGNKVLFRFALAFLKYHSPTLLSIDDSLALNQYLRVLGYRTSDVNHLFHISFNSLNPFRMRAIRAKRQHYTQWVTSELNKLDQIRKSIPEKVQENNDNSDSD